MAKKFVRGITDIKTIEHQDFDTNNVNDLLSDGQNNYIHRKKGNSEEYHNLTNNIKTIQSDDTDLLTVTNYNNTTNSATICPKHDAQKEQVLESTDSTILISHGENGTDESTTVDVNPTKVLEHNNLLTSYGISKTKSGNTTTLSLEYTRIDEPFDLNTLENGCVRSNHFNNAPVENKWLLVSAYSETNYTVQQAIRLSDEVNTTYRRARINGVWGQWREQLGDKSVIDELLAQKEQVLESTDNTILISHGENGTDETTTVDINPAKVLEMVAATTTSYSHEHGLMKTFVRKVSDTEEEFSFLAQMDKGENTVGFSANSHDLEAFQYLIDTYGASGTGTLNINGDAFRIDNGTTIIFNGNNANYNPHVVTFKDIIPISATQ